MALLMLEMLPLTRGTLCKNYFFHTRLSKYIRIASLNFGRGRTWRNRDWTQRGCSFHPLFQCQDAAPPQASPSQAPSPLPHITQVPDPVNSISYSSWEPESKIMTPPSPPLPPHLVTCWFLFVLCSESLIFDLHGFPTTLTGIETSLIPHQNLSGAFLPTCLFFIWSSSNHLFFLLLSELTF